MLRLKEIRENKKMTQRELAKLCNITPTTYNAYETKGVEPTIETLIKMANIFNVSLDYLCGNDTGFLLPPITKPQEEAIKILLKLPNNAFYIELGRLITLAEKYNIQYQGEY